MATFSNFVQSVTQDKIVPSVIEGAVNGNVLSMRLMRNGESWNGEALKRPLMHSLNSAVGSYSGYDTLSTAHSDTRVLMSFDPRSSYASVVLSNLELAVNATQAKVLDLLAVEMETAKISLMDNIGTQFFADGTGNSNKDFLGLKAHVDDGTVVATYGGLTRSSYSALQSSVTSSVGAITRGRLATAFDAAVHGSEQPTLGVTDKATWSYIEALYAPQLRNTYGGDVNYSYVGAFNVAASMTGIKGEIGFRAIDFRGCPIVADEKCTSGYLYFLNEKFLKWYGLAHPNAANISLSTPNFVTGAYDKSPKVSGFAWTGLKEPVNQDAEIGQILILGNLVNWSPRHSSVLQGITS